MVVLGVRVGASRGALDGGLRGGCCGGLARVEPYFDNLHAPNPAGHRATDMCRPVGVQTIGKLTLPARKVYGS